MPISWKDMIKTGIMWENAARLTIPICVPAPIFFMSRLVITMGYGMRKGRL